MSALRTLRARLAARPDTEHEQAIVRIILGSIGWAVVFYEWEAIRSRNDALEFVLGVTTFYALAVAIFTHICLYPKVSVTRRYLGMFGDIGFVTLALILGQSSNVQGIVALYLWIPVGNGLRFGTRSLLMSLALSMAAFLLVMQVVPFWQEHRWFAIELMIGQVLIALYARALVINVQASREAAEQANRAKSRFIAAASHDLRQPMQALSLYASTLDSNAEHLAKQRALNGVQLSVQTLEQLFDSLIDISKVEAGVIKPRLVAFPLMELLERIVEIERPLAALKNVGIDLVPTSVHVRSDPLLLERILKNLLTNAVRYTEKGRVAVGVRRLSSKRIQLCVVDTGIGIADAEQDQIFNEFYQVDGTQGQGAGLGLTIVRSLSELLGHRLSVTSRLGRGSSFALELDIDEQPSLGHPLPNGMVGSIAGACVVVIDDDESIRESMSILLEQWGCRAVPGRNLAEVHERLGRETLSPDIVIADYHLADSMNGIQAIGRMRDTYGASLPALLITGTADIDELRSNSFAIPIIGKPVQAAKIRAFINHSLR